LGLAEAGAGVRGVEDEQSWGLGHAGWVGWGREVRTGCVSRIGRGHKAVGIPASAAW
jgi:hypothetical protein